jgi:hypothetical protein
MTSPCMAAKGDSSDSITDFESLKDFDVWDELASSHVEASVPPAPTVMSSSGDLRSCRPSPSIGKPRQLACADLDRHHAQILAIEFEQIECEHHGLGLDPRAVAQPIEHRNAALVADRNLAVDQAGIDFQRHHRLEHGRISIGPIIAVACEQPAADAVALRHQAVAVVLDLVHPLGAGAGPVRCGGKTGLNEAAGRPALNAGTHKHGGNIRRRGPESESLYNTLFAERTRSWMVMCCRALENTVCAS